MPNYAIFRVEKLGSKSAATKRQQHNIRSKGAALSDRSGKANVKDLIMADTALKANKDAKKTFGQFSRERIGDQKVRKNACFGFEAILTFSPGALKPEQLKDWAGESMRFIANVFGKDNLFSAQIHLSETTPHIHIIASAIDAKGKLNANGIIRGPAHLRELQTEYAKHMERFGLQRGIDKKQTKARHKSCERWYAEQADKELRLNAYEKFFGKEEDWDIDTAIKFTSTQHDLRSAQEATESHRTRTNDFDKDLPLR